MLNNIKYIIIQELDFRDVGFQIILRKYQCNGLTDLKNGQ